MKDKSKYNKNLKVIEIKDEFDNKGYKIEGLVYETLDEAKFAINELIRQEYLSRSKNDGTIKNT